MFGIGLTELIFVFLIIFLLFGAKALPDIARSLGQTVKAFRNEVNNFKNNLEVMDQEQQKFPHDKPQEGGGVGDANDYKPDIQKTDWRPESSTDQKEV